MDWEMQDEFEIDLDYEFDAPKFYDFTRSETEFEGQEADFWFGTAGNYPPSPFVVSWDWKQYIDVEVAEENLDPNSTTNLELGSKSSKAKPKSPYKSSLGKSLHYRSSTTSQLAKQYHSPEILCDRLLRSFQKLSIEGDKKCLSKSSPIETQAAKRQKLEAGYLRKGGLLDTKSMLSRRKVTIPREPVLVTSYRAERHRSKINSELVEHAKTNVCNFRARPLNRKILETPSMPLPKRSPPPMPHFQVSHLGRSVRAKQNASVDTVDRLDASPDSQNVASSRRVTRGATSTNSQNLDKSQARCLRMKEFNSEAAKRFPNEPPKQLLSKLSSASEWKIPCSGKSQRKMLSQSKASKENAPAYLLKHEMPVFQCGRNRRTPSSIPQMPISRRLEIS